MKCALYIRVSTEHESQTESLTNQEHLLMQYIKFNNFDLFKIYTDRETATGAKERLNFNRMMDDAKNGLFDIILAKDISRLTRDTFKLKDFNTLYYKYNINTITLDGAIDTLKNEDLDDAILNAFMGEKTSKMSSVKIKSGLRSRAAQGFFKGAIPPYGYYVDNGRLKIRKDNTPDIVKRIFTNYLKGHGTDRIAKNLFEDNIPTPAFIANKSNKSNFWHGSTIRLILKNRHYTGDLCQCKTSKPSFKRMDRINLPVDKHIVVENAHEAIITKETFMLVQKLIETRSKKVGKYRKSPHLFSNIGFCDTCGKGMHFRKNRRGYICGSYDKFGVKACSSHLIKEEDLLNIVKNDLKIICSKIDINLNEIAKTKIHKKIETLKKQLPNLDKELSSINQRRITMLNNLSTNTIDKESYDLFIKALNEEIKNLHDKYNSIKNQIASFNQIDLSSLKKLKNDLLNVKILDKAMLSKLIFKITIKENGDVKIYYRFSRLLELI